MNARSMRRAGAAMMLASAILASTVGATPSMHPALTATGTLFARFVTPADGDASPVEATAVTVATALGGGVLLEINGTPVDDKHLGKRIDDRKTGESQVFYYGIPLNAGPNVITATPLGAGDARGKTVSETVFGPDQASTIRMQAVQHLIADGKTTVPINIFVNDRYGHPASPSERVHISILRGDVAFVDMPKATPPPRPGVEATPDVTSSSDPQAQRVTDLPLPVGGYFALKLIPGTVAGPLELEVSVAHAYARQTFYVEPFVRSAFVNGVVSAGIGSVPGAMDGDGNPDNGGARRGRAGLFANGAVGKSLLTVVYESQNRLSPVSSFGSYADDPNERPYLTYGDASHIVDPYHSADHLYARIDRGRSNLMWGQYNVNIGPTEVGSYQRLQSGAKAEISIGNTGRLNLSGFTANNDQAFVSEVLPVSGLATLMQPLHPDIVVGSDDLQLVTLDRHTGLVVQEADLIRNIDYTIDYGTGILRFINIPLPYDASFNPQVVSLRYEYQGSGVQSRTTGGQAVYRLSADGNTKLLGSYVNDASGTQNFALSAESLSRTWDGGSWSISHANSYGALPTGTGSLQLGGGTPQNGGAALTATLNERSADNMLALAYQQTNAGYNDPFGGFSSPGVTAYQTSWTHGTPVHGALSLTASGESNHGVGTAGNESDLAMQYVRRISRSLTGTLGLLHHAQRVGGSAIPAPSASPALPSLDNTTQMQVQGGLVYHSTKRLGAAISESLTVSGPDVGSTQPSQTMLEATYQLPKRGELFVRELWSRSPSATFANSTSDLNIGGSSTHSVQLGVQQAISPATTISSQYVVDQTGSALDVYDALGVEEHLKLSKAVSANVQVQGANAVGAGAQGFTLASAALAYAAPSNALRASLGYQMRTGSGGGSTANAGIAGHLSPSLGVMGFIQRAYGNGVDAINDRVSLAYRPLQNDRFVSLAGYTRTNGASLTGGSSGQYSFEELYRPMEQLEIAGRFAYTEDGAGATLAHSALYALRVRRYVGMRNDIGAEMRIIEVPGVATARATEFALEAGHTFGRATRIGVGYNAAGSVDPTLVGQDARRGFYANVTTLLDSIFGWGKNSP